MIGFFFLFVCFLFQGLFPTSPFRDSISQQTRTRQELLKLFSAYKTPTGWMLTPSPQETYQVNLYTCACHICVEICVFEDIHN